MHSSSAARPETSPTRSPNTSAEEVTAPSEVITISDSDNNSVQASSENNMTPANIVDTDSSSSTLKRSSTQDKSAAKRYRPSPQIMITDFSRFQPLNLSSVGDVAIVLDPGSFTSCLTVDRVTLERSSSWFTKVIAEFEDLDDSNSNIEYLFVLEGSSARHNTPPMLVRKPLSAITDILKECKGTPGPATVTNGTQGGTQASTEQVTSTNPEIKAEPSGETTPPPRKKSDPKVAHIWAYTALFNKFHGTKIRLDKNNTRNALVQAEILVELGKRYACLSAIDADISNNLMGHRNSLYVSISSNPPRWLHLALALENEVIFAESLIHMVGAWPKWPWKTARSSVPDDILTTVEEKGKALLERQREVKEGLFINTIKVGESSGGHKGTTATLDKDFETWMIVQIFRDWLSSALSSITDDTTGRLGSTDPLKTGRLFRELARGRDNYLPFDRVYANLRKLDGQWDDVGEDLWMLKSYAADVVHDSRLCVNNLTLDAESAKIGYLTCAEVGREDMPWEKVGTAKMEVD